MGFRILADENMPMVEALFGHIASDLKTMPGRLIRQADVIDRDILLVRSVTQVDEKLLSGTAVKFVGSATIGMDHIDVPWLSQQRIACHSSPGCNADAVVDYVVAALVHWQIATGNEWRHKTIGVVGCGNVGGRLVSRLRGAGVPVLCFDPPLAARQSITTSKNSLEFCTLNDLLKADVICLHTPLTRDGPYPTHHLFDQAVISCLKPGALLLNAGRGSVIQQSALKARLNAQGDITAILDVWETEPAPDLEVMQATLLSTPHIAGYSLDGKIRGTWMLHNALMNWCGGEAVTEPVSQAHWPEPYVWNPKIAPSENLSAAVNRIFSITRDSDVMRQSLLNARDKADCGYRFDQLRKHYGVRREFSCLVLLQVPTTERRWLQALGFQCPV